MFILKGCPRCKGDLNAETSLRRREADADVSRIQCGYLLRQDEQNTFFRRRGAAGSCEPLAQQRAGLQPAPAYAAVRR